ncbi:MULTISPECIES: nitrate/nitrite transporter NrtS [Gammaproteobacteria]|uniref:Nitrate/nitrite transporter NrtS n=2 Tax=Aliikangiella maris TaxID=3162458 RepID=A0ABV2BYE7_9GAMM|nr:nitrate/nitrite transporter NrtS [Cycloclasticus sp. P1]AFT67514.1 hypothetical protein Q91_1477 [Cycloclasticus sp. P1]
MKFQLQELVRNHGFKAAKVALIVGTILLIINQFNAIFADQPFRWLPAALTYIVPFFVFLLGKHKEGEE